MPEGHRNSLPTVLAAIQSQEQPPTHRVGFRQLQEKKSSAGCIFGTTTWYSTSKSTKPPSTASWRRNEQTASGSFSTATMSRSLFRIQGIPVGKTSSPGGWEVTLNACFQKSLGVFIQRDHMTLLIWIPNTQESFEFRTL